MERRSGRIGEHALEELAAALHVGSRTVSARDSEREREIRLPHARVKALELVQIKVQLILAPQRDEHAHEEANAFGVRGLETKWNAIEVTTQHLIRAGEPSLPKKLHGLLDGM
jgi:hypothetical protein